MWNFERQEIRDKAVAWCVEHKIEVDPLGVVIALDALGLLNDPAVEHRVQNNDNMVLNQDQEWELVKKPPAE